MVQLHRAPESRPADRERLLGGLNDAETAIKRKELTELLAMMDLAPVDGTVIDRAKSSFAINLRAIDAIRPSRPSPCWRPPPRTGGWLPAIPCQVERLLPPADGRLALVRKEFLAKCCAFRDPHCCVDYTTMDSGEVIKRLEREGWAPRKGRG